MVHLTVYYNPNADYDHGTNNTATVMVSIDSKKAVDTLTAHVHLFKNLPFESILHRKDQATFGIFNDGGICHKMDDGTECINKIKHIDYKTIMEKELKQILRDRFSEVEQCLVDPDIEIECIRGVPPT